MLKKHEPLYAILDIGVVAIVRVDDIDSAQKAVDACLEGGLKAVEITFTYNSAFKIIDKISSSRPECVLGAGTVLDSETARIAILSGAQYIISPSFNKETALLCNRYAVPYMPGCYTPKDIVEAMEYGVDVVKLFPGSGRSPSILKAYHAPLPQANVMPTGGISLDNAAEWIKAGAVALGVGGDLTAGVRNGDFKSITEKSRAYIEVIAQARKE